MEQYNNYYDYDEEEISLLEIYEIIKKNVGLIIIATLSMALLAFLISVVLNSVKTPKIFYQAVTKIEVVVEDEEKKEQILQAVMELMRGDIIIKRAMEKNGIDGDVGIVRQNIQVLRVENTDVLEIIVNNEKQENAEKLMDEILVQGISLINDILPVEEFKTIQKTIMLKEVVQMTSEVDFKLSIGVGGILGFMGIIVLILLKYVFNDKIISEEYVRKYFGLKVLVSIPDCTHGLRIRRYFRIR